MIQTEIVSEMRRRIAAKTSGASKRSSASLRLEENTTNFPFPVTRLPSRSVTRASLRRMTLLPVPGFTACDPPDTARFTTARGQRQIPTGTFNVVGGDSPALGWRCNTGHRHGRCHAWLGRFVLTQRRSQSQRQAASIEYDGLVCVHQNAVVEMPSYCPRKHDLFKIRTLLDEVLQGITVGNTRDVLFDDRTIV